jgi:hypothetical protein
VADRYTAALDQLRTHIKAVRAEPNGEFILAFLRSGEPPSPPGPGPEIQIGELKIKNVGGGRVGLVNAPADAKVRLKIGSLSYTNASEGQGAYLQLLGEIEHELARRQAGKSADVGRTTEILKIAASWGQMVISGAALGLAILRGG